MVRLYAIRNKKIAFLNIVFLANRITAMKIANEVPISVRILNTGLSSNERCKNINDGHNIANASANNFRIAVILSPDEITIYSTYKIDAA
ncbi:hypothetical protein NIHE141904_12530 [Enterobacter hormaechei]|nr:hypothetical protein NIHE141904_12530 [Enterobacter hormaechei]